MIRRGVVLIPEKRANGVFRSLSIIDNVCNLFLKTDICSPRLGIVRKARFRALTQRVLDDNKVKYTSPEQAISGLSGGNMQKVIIGRSVEVEGIKLLILDEPTTGMDIGAKHMIYEKIRQLVDERSLGVMFISSELDELLATCDRICVFADGNCVDSFEREAFDKRRILETAVRGKKVEG